MNQGLLIALIAGGAALTLAMNKKPAGPTPSPTPTPADAVSPALKALGQWSLEAGISGPIGLGEYAPGQVVPELETGSVVVDVTPETIRFMRVGTAHTLVSDSALANAFKTWLAQHPELTQ